MKPFAPGEMAEAFRRGGPCGCDNPHNPQLVVEDEEPAPAPAPERTLGADPPGRPRSLAETPILGVDPGQSGGAVLLDASGVILVAPWKSESGWLELLRYLPPHTIAWVEKVASMPGQGVASMFKFGRHFGYLLGSLAVAGIPVNLVAPQTWQKGLMLPKAATKTEHKNNLKDAATRLWPAIKWTHATADAYLIARYGFLNS